MENKYDRAFWEFEQQHKQKGKEIDRRLQEQFNLKTGDKNFGNGYLDSICLNFHLYDRDFKEWVINGVLPYFTDETLISCYLIKLTDALMLKDGDKLNSIITSFKAIKLIKDAEIKENNIILTTNNNEEIKVKNIFKDIEERDKFRGRCHNGCEYLIKNEEIFTKYLTIVTLRDRYIGKYPLYHTVILVRGKYIVDPARNLVMKLEDYKRLLKPYVIMCINKDLMLKEIEHLKENDDDFSNSKLNNVLKLAIKKQNKLN